MKRLAIGLLNLILVVSLVSPPLVGTYDSVVYPCTCSTAPTLDGVLSDGEWDSDCSFERELRGIPENVTDNGSWHLEYPPFNQTMTLYVMNDTNNHYLALQWDHHWLNNTGDEASSPDKYLVGLGFDFDHDHVIEDADNNPYTIDDVVVIAYLAFTIGEPNATGWLAIYIPQGLYELSWNATANDIQDITQDPGPLDRDGNPVTFNYGVGRDPSGFDSDVTYTYTFEIAIPNVLFHSPAGFAFSLSQETNFVVEGTQYNETYGWTWPTEWLGYYFNLDDPSAPTYMGTLADIGPYSVFEFPNDVFNAPDNTAWYVLGDYVLHSRNGVKFRDSAAKHSPLVAAIATDIFASQYFYGGSSNPQNVILDTNSAYISQGDDDFGNATVDGPIVTVGGPSVNQVVYYYMFNTNETQLFYDSAAGAIKRRDTGATVTSEGSSWTSDVFVVEAFVDSQGRVVYMFWGKVYLGTMAATCFMMEVLLKPTNPYANTSWFVVRWNEATSGASVNGMPDGGDTYTVIESGPPL